MDEHMSKFDKLIIQCDAQEDHHLTLSTFYIISTFYMSLELTFSVNASMCHELCNNGGVLVEKTYFIQVLPLNKKTNISKIDSGDNLNAILNP